MPEARSGPTVGQIVLGLRLRELREKAGHSFDHAAKALRVNQTTVRRMERAEVGLKPVYVEKLLQTYGASPKETEDFLAMVDEANRPGWWHKFRDVLPDWFTLYVSLEGAASLIRAYEPHCVPGLLQTEAYARALLRAGFPSASEEELDRRVALRRGRQELLTGPEAPHLWAVVDETVLRRPVGGADVMREQLDRLAAATELPHVKLQVLPLAADPHPAMYGPFQLFRFRAPELPDIVYTENLTGALYLDDRGDISAYRKALDHMCTQAPPPRRTAQLLRDVRKEI